MHDSYTTTQCYQHAFSSIHPEIQPCDPNPCQNSGMCESTNKGTPSCSCDLYFKGEFCDIGIVYTPALPILLVNEQSSLLYINASTKSELQIEINSVDWVTVIPKGKLSVDPKKKVASFKLTSESIGVSTIAYILQSDGFEQPSSGILLTVHTKADSGNDYFSRNNLDSGIVRPGCCKKSTEFDETYCSDNLQQITFSSSCSWVPSNDQSLYMTKGITFIHINELSLPLSVAGLDATLSSNVLDISVLSENIDCYECSDRLSLSNQCKNGNVSPADISDMLHSKTLMKTFINNTMSLVPPQIQFKLIDTSIFRFYAYDFHASLSLPSSVSGCEGFAEQSDGLMYFVKSSNGLVVMVHDSQVQYYPSNNEQPICFGLEVCKGKLSPLYASFSKQAANVITTLPFFSIYKTSGWKFSIRSTSMSAYGLSSIINNVFWNGTDNINISVPIYDTKLNMEVDGNVSNEWQTAKFKFSGSMFSNNGDDNNGQVDGIM